MQLEEGCWIVRVSWSYSPLILKGNNVTQCNSVQFTTPFTFTTTRFRSIEVPGQSILSEEMDDLDEEGGDPVKLERLRRAELQSRRMSVPQYMEFSGARAVSFGKGAKVRHREV